ncbi:MAG: RluA family pseudouridine synthase [Anaeroplasmataceae bacterium]|jgi:pseudouridine synthase, RluA family|nr:RluA family pseudouridine synthase [Anaeroplasmataceae bacterium]
MKTNYKITKETAGFTLKEYIASFHLGKKKQYEFFSSKAIQVNGEIGKEDQILAYGDCITIRTEESVDFLPDKKKLDVLYEDDYLLIINKPAHILVHPDDKNKQGTLCNIVSYYYQNKGLEYSIKYAHRLDMDTTGILLFAKDSLTLAKLDDMISKHEVKRTYLCLAAGKFKQKIGTIHAPIGEDRHHQQRKRISKTGKPAITHYEVLKEYKNYSLVKVQLETGRTHQIRVHFSSIGHPLLGDVLYGNKDERASRVYLHSYQVEFIHPVTYQVMQLTKELPFDMKKLV